MIKPRSCFFVVLLCFGALFYEPPKLRAQAMLSPEIQGRIDQIGACLLTKVVEKDDPRACQELLDRMVSDHVQVSALLSFTRGPSSGPRASVWYELGGAPVTAETLFQAGSMSKPVAAMAALHLADQGKLPLDSNVNQALTSWKIPPQRRCAGSSGYAAPVAQSHRRAHSARISGLCCRCAHSHAGSNSERRKTRQYGCYTPGSSPGNPLEILGGGYTIMQQLLLDVSHQPFPRLLHDTVLAPIGMTRSTYEQPLPLERRAAAATPHQNDGTPVAGGLHTYPETGGRRIVDDAYRPRKIRD